MLSIKFLSTAMVVMGPIIKSVCITDCVGIVLVTMIGYVYFRGNPYSLYQRAMIASAATSALRLHQRVPAVQFNMEFLRQLFLEDSCHYLFFAILFINSYPITSILLFMKRNVDRLLVLVFSGLVPEFQGGLHIRPVLNRRLTAIWWQYLTLDHAKGSERQISDLPLIHQFIAL